MKKLIIVLTALSTLVGYTQEIKTETTQTNLWTGDRPDGHAPISVMGDHLHNKGGLMLSYRYMYMNMSDVRRGDEDVLFSNALVDYMVTPTRMPMKMHMVGVMYAPTNNLTLSVMGNYLENEMDHVTRMGGVFTTKSGGIGDTKVSALYKIFNKKHTLLHARLGVSLPTGGIEEMDVIPASMGNNVLLPYPMQIGSGTFDVEGAATFLWQIGNFSGGNQLTAVYRTGENDNEYTLGNRYSLNNWFAIKASDVFSFSLRFKGERIGEIEGVNPALNPMMVITADTANSGGTIVDGGVGINFYIPGGTLKNLRIGAELSHPLYQDLNGVQLKTNEVFTTGIQYAF